MEENIKNSEEEVKDNCIYGYKVNGVTCWTSNLEFARIRAYQNNNDSIVIEKN